MKFTISGAVERRLALISAITSAAGLVAAASAPAATGDIAINSATLNLRQFTVSAACRHDAVARLRLDGRASARANLRCRGTSGRAEFRLSAADAARARSSEGIVATVAVSDGENVDRFTARLRRPALGRRARGKRIAKISSAAHWYLAGASCVSHPEYSYRALGLTAYSETYGLRAGQYFAYRMWVLTAAANGTEQKWFTNGYATGFAALYPMQHFPLSGSNFWASVGVENAYGEFRWVRLTQLAGAVERGYSDHDWCFMY